MTETSNNKILKITETSNNKILKITETSQTTPLHQQQKQTVWIWRSKMLSNAGKTFCPISPL